MYGQRYQKLFLGRGKLLHLQQHTAVHHFENIYHKYVFAYRKHCGCDTAILSLTERWKQELDNHKVIGVVPMDLSKVFHTLPHDLIVLN